MNNTTNSFGSSDRLDPLSHMQVRPATNSPEHLELIAGSQPEMLTPRHWELLNDWRRKIGALLPMPTQHPKPYEPGKEDAA